MKIISTIIYCILILFKGLFLIARLLFEIAGFLFKRAESRHSFKRGLRECGVPEDVAVQLADSYGEMVRIRDLTNIGRFKKSNRI